MAIEQAQAGVIYDEATSGDLSGSGLTPTLLSVGLGENNVLGTTGRGATVDRDYFTFNVPVGFELTSIAVLPGTTVGGLSGFIGMQSGSQVTLPVNASTAAGLLGWLHYTPTSGEILDDMSKPANGSSGYTPPLGAGNYAFWVQDTSSGTASYGFEFGIHAVPDTGPGVIGYVAALGLLGAFGARVRCRA